MDKNEFLQLL